MATAKIILPTPHTGQMTVLKEQRRFNVLCCGRRFGKGLGLETDIPTPFGMKKLQSICVGDQVFGADGAPTTVTYVSPVHRDLVCFRITFDDGTTVDCDEDHRWFTYTKLDRKAMDRTDRGHRDTGGSVKTTPEIAASLRHGEETNHHIPVAGALRYPEKVLPLDPYVLGAWLGDGHTAEGRITCDDASIIDSVVAAGFPRGAVHNTITHGVNNLKVVLRTTGVLGRKHIPEEYLYASIDQRLALLQGLMDTDGYVGKDGFCEFSNTNPTLSRGVQTLLYSLGQKALFYEKRATLYGKDCGPCYRVFFHPSIPVFRLQRKLDRQTPPKKTQARRYIRHIEVIPTIPTICLQVDAPDHLFLVTKACIPTHNTTFGIDRIIRPALEGWPVAWFAPEDKFYEEVWKDLLITLKPVLNYKNSTKRLLGLVGGGNIDIWNMAHPENVARGRKYKMVVVDEAAQIPNLQQAWEQAISPTLIDYKGGAWFFSTPRGFNAFHRLYQEGVEADKRIAEALEAGLEPKPEDWKSWQMPSHANPHLPPEELERMREKNTPKNYSQEVLAQFLGEGTAVFPNVEEQATGRVLPYNPSHQYAIGVDWGRDNDWTVFTVIDIMTKAVVWIETTSKIEFHHQRDRLQALAERYHPAMILTEMNAIGVPNFEELQRKGLPVSQFWTTNASKQELVDALVLALSRNQLTLLDKDQFVDNIRVGQECKDQLHAFESTRLPSGMIKYGAPEGTHDDMVMSLGLAWLCALAPDKAAFTHKQLEDATSDSPTWAL